MFHTEINIKPEVDDELGEGMDDGEQVTIQTYLLNSFNERNKSNAKSNNANFSCVSL